MWFLVCNLLLATLDTWNFEVHRRCLETLDIRIASLVYMDNGWMR